ncbi:Carboxypeptidase regulatory-like domain-containing protein [Amycolatopsis pretoriensis]|uniref:Carboxypeptidase regulatory-like domain-containing protein n=1 Tax=Amycolatopsis pretoriensis TaxID=218821 RepID=A0A1H5R807_9PSEU|nr:carboxypeptidase regulatory-like domain-containing protein [Amycolatopsis pretoriensis]SEF33721.1 Carboxypeptidase regulatory-like domain-containing protein [Amycolatopsis pretoriensis]
MALAVLVAVVGWAVPAAAAGYDLRGTAVVEDGLYLPGDHVTVKYTITNVGDTTVYRAHGFAGVVDGTSFFVESGWGDLGSSGGADFAPGESREYAITGSIGHPSAGPAKLRLSVDVIDGVTPPLAVADVTIPVAEGSSAIGGQVFGDADQDGVADPGEGLAGAHVQLYGYGVRETATTGPDGRFSFPDLAPGEYSLYTSDAPGGWLTLGGSGTVRLDGTVPVVDVPLRAVRPLSETLRAKLSLDKESYHAGDPAVMTVKLVNTGSRVVSGLYGSCDGVGYGRDLAITSAGWGELDYFGAGATIRPGETRVFRVPGTVRDVSGSWGFLEQYCDFGNEKAYAGAPVGRDTAKVTGRTGTSTGRIVTEAGDGLAGQVVKATDVDTHRVLTATTGADGTLTFTGPAGRYELSVRGPWVLDGPSPVYVVAAPLNGNGWVFTRHPA